MKYIQRVGELVVAPPFLLGEPPTYRYHANVFALETDRTRLIKLVEEQLNAALPNGPVHYTVPTTVKNVFLAFLRYDRAESASQADAGWLSYTEALIGFLVLRHHLTKDQPDELLTFLGVVYIDDSAYTGQVQDPQALPIVLGREAYGLPKHPGQIRYQPYQGWPNAPRLQAWDTDLTLDKRLELADAIVVTAQSEPVIQPVPDEELEPADSGSPQGRGAAAPASARLGARAGRGPASRILRRPQTHPRRTRLRPPLVPREPSRTIDEPFHILALQLGLRGAAELDPKPIDLPPPSFGATRVSLPEEGDAIVYEELLWNTRLVGLKQFPDPRSPVSASNLSADACYQAIVETPLRETEPSQLQTVIQKQIVDFPPLQRVDLMDVFGIAPTSPQEPRRVHVEKTDMYYQEGGLEFAEPDGVVVWDPA